MSRQYMWWQDRVYDLWLLERGKELYKIYKKYDDKTYSGFIKKVQKVLSKDDLKKLIEILNKLVKAFSYFETIVLIVK